MAASTGLRQRSRLVTSAAFGGSIDTCLRASCPDAYMELLDCADPVMLSGACDDALATECGLGQAGAP